MTTLLVMCCVVTTFYTRFVMLSVSFGFFPCCTSDYNLSSFPCEGEVRRKAQRRWAQPIHEFSLPILSQTRTFPILHPFPVPTTPNYRLTPCKTAKMVLTKGRDSSIICKLSRKTTAPNLENDTENSTAKDS